jgi:hypothetical protein
MAAVATHNWEELFLERSLAVVLGCFSTGDGCSRLPYLKDSLMLCMDNGRTLNALISVLYFPQIVGACFVGRPLYLSGPTPFYTRQNESRGLRCQGQV